MEVTDPAARIAHAIARFGLDVSTIGDVPDSHSSIVRILTLHGGEQVVIKIPWSRDKWERECRALGTLGGIAFTPRVLDAFADDAGHQAILMSRLPGVPVGTPERCTPALAREIGGSIAVMHGLSMSRTGTDAESLGWWPWLLGFVQGALEACRRHSVPGDWDFVERSFTSAVSVLPPVTELRMVMFDCRLGNMLAESGRMTGLIDFESARNGSRDIDFAKLERDFEMFPAMNAAMRSGYAEVLPLPAHLDAAVALYRLYEPVVSVGFCLKRGRGAGDTFFDSNLAAVARCVEAMRRNQG